MNNEEKLPLEPKKEIDNLELEESKNFIERNKVFQFSEFIVSNKKIFQIVLLIGALFEVYKIIFKYRLEKDWTNIGFSLFFIAVYVYFINHLKTNNRGDGGLET